MNLPIDELTNLIGTWIKNAEGDTIGTIEDVFIDSERQIAEYFVLRCEELFGDEDRYFAIPVCRDRIIKSQGGKIALAVTKEALPVARGVRADKCPRFNPLIPSNTVYELYEYESVQLSRIT